MLLPAAPPVAKDIEKAATHAERKLSAVLDALEEQLGGRKALVQTLLAHPKPSLHLDDFLKRMLDIDPDGCTDETRSLGWLCLHSGLTTGELLRSYQEAILHIGQTLSKKLIGEALPAVTQDVLQRALPSAEPCRVCNATGKVKEKPCAACEGRGSHQYVPDLERQKVALDLGEMFPKKGGGVTVAQQVNLPPAGLPAGAFSRLQQTGASLIAGASLPIVDATPE